MDQNLKWVCHAALKSLSGKRKPNTNHFFPILNHLKKNLKNVAFRSNIIPIRPRTSSKKLYTNLKDEEKKFKTTPTSKQKHFELKYSKWALYTEIKTLKKMFKKLIQD